MPHIPEPVNELSDNEKKERLIPYWHDSGRYGGYWIVKGTAYHKLCDAWSAHKMIVEEYHRILKNKEATKS